MTTKCTSLGCSSHYSAMDLQLHHRDSENVREEPELSAEGLHMSRMHRSMLSPVRSVPSLTRKNKRKNFQPRNIRPTSAEEGDDAAPPADDVNACDTHDDSALCSFNVRTGIFSSNGDHSLSVRNFASLALQNAEDSSQSLREDRESSGRKKKREDPLDLSEGSSPVKRKTTNTTSEPEDESSSRDGDELLEGNSGSSRGSSRAGSSSRSPSSEAAVDLSFRPQSDSDDEEMDSKMSQLISLYTQAAAQQQPFNNRQMADLAESTMRDILGMYGLSREAATQLSMTSGKFLPPYPIERSTSSIQAAAVPAASAPSQPPTPPHTPKTANTNGRIQEMRGSDPALVALQAHMQSVLRAAGGPATVSSRSSTPGATLTFSYPLSPAKTAAAALTSTTSSRVGNNSAETKSFAILNNDAQQLHHPAAHVSPSALGVPVITTALGGKQLLSSGSRGSGNGDGSKGTPIDYTRYVKRFTSAMECGSPYCKDLNYREHFHCLDCHARVFVKKEEMIRHFKWHKKRDESLQHGFMRYSPMDDCSDRFRGCSHNRKQTHYHCLKEGCDKVYISTSDVQMHANYHRKDSAIIQEGFQRYRATEDCATSYCAFNGQRTTHFHCRRTGCNYTFKNKADMEKHKSYHIKDEQLCRDGFKKFMKNESCNFDNCRFSKVCNHIHCIRAGCTYVLHSSGQLYSHKRKHERRDSELAYRQYRNEGVPFTPESIGLSGEFSSPGFSMHFNLPLSLSDPALAGDLTQQHALMNLPSELQRTALANPSLAFLYGRLPGMFHSLDSTSNGSVPDNANENTSMDNRSPSPVMSDEDAFRLCVKKIEAGKKCCNPPCELSPNEHYHCQAEGCTLSLKYLDAAKEHWRNHEQQEHITDNFFTTVEVAEDPVPCPLNCPYQAQQKHYHCNWENCSEIISALDKPFRRLDHFKMHEYARRGGPGSLPSHTSSKEGSPAATTAFSLDSMFRRKRGRPPKNRFIEVWNESAPSSSGSANSDMPQAIFTSFKLPKPSTPPLSSPSPGTNFFMSPFPTPNLMPLCLTSKPTNTEMKPMISPTNSSHSDSTAAGRCEGEAKIATKSEKNSPRSIPSPSGTQRSESPPRATVVKAAGTFYPLSAFPGKGDPPVEDAQSSSITSFPPQGNGSPFLPSLVAEKPIAYGPEQSCGRPFCKLKRRDHYHCVVCNQAFSEVERLKPHMLKHCNGALSPNMAQWSNSSEKPKDLKEDPDKETENSKQEKAEREEAAHRSEGLDTRNFPATPGPSSQADPFTSMSAMTAEVGRPSALHALAFMSRPPYGLIPPPPQSASPASGFSTFMGPDLSTLYGNSGLLLGTHQMAYGAAAAAAAAAGVPAAAGGPSPQQPLSPDHLLGSEAKKMRFQSSMRILKDEPVPEGYVRYRFNEDCQYPHCGYREHQTHFHCMRPDCGYSFCDKTRFVQHTARHERLDTLMGGDFQQYRANVSCGRQGCLYTASLGSVQNKASHFHCLKCDFVCTDTNKVVAHRRQHQKTDSILAAGFEKFTPSQSCRVDSCPHSNKQTHYHCLKCCYAVLGLAQMSAHKYRHMD